MFILLPHGYVDLSPANKILLVCMALLDLISFFRFNFSGSDPTGKRAPGAGLAISSKNNLKIQKNFKKEKTEKM